MPALLIAAGCFAASKMHLGLNLGAVTYYDAETPFKDVYKLSKPFNVAKGSATFDASGYPTSLSSDGFLQAVGPPTTGYGTAGHPPENYTFLFDGDCSGCEINRCGPKSSSCTTAPGRWTDVLVDSPKYWTIKVRSVDPSDPPRNFRFFPSRFSEAGVTSDPWNPAWLALWEKSGLQSLRFMDWAGTNGNTIEHWGDRTLPSNATQSQGHRGVAWEHVAALANRLRFNPWVNIPIAADDEYVRGLAALLLASVDPSLRVTVELSNEVWNFGFAQYHYAAQAGFAKGLDTQASEKSANYWYSDRVCEVAAIFRDVFGAAAHRLYFVMGTWTNQCPEGSCSFPVTSRVLTWNDNHKCVDAVAITGYYGVGRDSSGTQYDTCFLANRTVDEFFAIWNNESMWSQWRVTHAAQANYTKQFGLDLVAYESGLGLTGDRSSPCADSFGEFATRVFEDPRTAQMAYRNIVEFEALGAVQMNIFDSVGWSHKIYGSWGQLRDMDSVGTDGGYKWQGVLQWLGEQQEGRTSA